MFDDEKQEKLLKAFDVIASMPDGLIVFQHILEVTGYQADLMRFNESTRELNPQASLYNLSKRDVWTALRPLLSPDRLRDIEIPTKYQAERKLIDERRMSEFNESQAWAQLAGMQYSEEE